MRFKPAEIALNKASGVLILIVLITVIGFLDYRALPRESAPDIQIPRLIVTIPYPGSSPEDVEALIIHKAETEFKGLDQLKEMKSTATEGAAMITLEFVLGVDIDEARARVRESLDRVAPELPAEAEDPLIKEINLSERPIMIVNLAGKLGLLRLKEIAEDLKDRIEGVHGVLEVKRAGGLEREVRIEVDPDKLVYYNLDLNQVSNTIQRENTSLPAGNITVGTMKYNIRVPGEITDPEEIKTMVITAADQLPIYTQDVAKVVYGFQEITSRSRKNGVDSVSLSVSKRTGENLIAISDEIKGIVAQEQGKWGDKVAFNILNDESKRIRSLVSDLENNIYTGLIFVCLVLMFFMGFKNSLFIAVAIPLSMLLSFIVISWVGMTLNFVVLFSLILALGMLVDNAIVVVENIYRHLESGLPRMEAARLGVGEVAVPVITSTLTTLAAFAPLLFMPGISGQFMSFLPKTLIITLTCSLVVGLLFNPVLCGLMMKNPKKLKLVGEDHFSDGSLWLRQYKKALVWSLDHRWKVVFAMLGLWVLLAGIYIGVVFQRAGVEFFPTSEPGSSTIEIKAPFGSTLETSDRLVRQVEAVIKPFWPATDAVVANIGQRQGSGGDSGSTTHLSHITLSFPDWSEWTVKPSEVIAQIRPLLEQFTGGSFTLSKPSRGPPSGKAVNLELYGNDLTQMKELSLEIQQRIKAIPGLVNLSDDFTSTRSEIQIKLDRIKIAKLGLNTREVAGIIRTAINGRKVSTYRIGKEEYDIIVRLDEAHRTSLNDIERLYVKTPQGQSVSLAELATILPTASKGSIRHIDSKTVITISADVEGISGPNALKKVQKNLKDFPLPKGYRIEYTGENESRKEMQQYLGKSFFIAIFLIFLILVLQFNSLLLPLIIMISVFLSFMGVFLGMIIHQSPVSIMMGGIGTISLAGVVVNNAIVLIDYINQLRAKGMERREAIVLAGMLRIRPVLLTAITTMLGLFPITIGLDINFYRPGIIHLGSESGAMWVPMARTVIYGLGVATGLTLIVVPVCYSLIDTGKKYWLGKWEGLLAWARSPAKWGYLALKAPAGEAAPVMEETVHPTQVEADPPQETGPPKKGFARGVKKLFEKKP